MGLIADLTSQHAKLDANLSVIRSELQRALQDGDLPDAARGRIGPRADEVRKLLEGYLQNERDEVFPHAERVLGETLEEITDMSACHEQMLEAFERFRQMLPSGAGRGAGQAAGGGHDLAELQRVFDDFLASFEEHRSVERNFYTLYGTILYPSGYATD